MQFKALNTSLAGDAVLLTPYLHDAKKGILPRIGDSILSGYSVGKVGWSGHSRGGGVLTHAYTNNDLPDTYSAVVFIDPV
eukprot:gene14512-18719_t